MYGITEILNSGKVGQEYKQLREQREMITEKWNQFGLLDGLEGSMAENIAQLYENQASYLINESTDATSSGSFETVAFPIIRRVFQKLLANEIVSVQSMNMPIGRLYFINPKISTRTAANKHTQFDGVYTNAADNYNSSGVKTGGTGFQSTSLYDSFYNTGSDLDDDGGLFDRTKGAIIPSGNIALRVISGFAGSAVTSQRILVQLTGFSTTSAGKLQGPVGAPMDTESFLMSLKVIANTEVVSKTAINYNIPAGQSIPFRMPMQVYGKEIVSSAGVITLELLTPAQRRKLKREATKLSQVETKQKDEEQYLKALSDPKFDEYFTQMDKNEKYRKDHPEIYKDPNWYAKLTPREKATMERKTKIANKEYFDTMDERNKKIQEKLDKEEEERQKKDKSWLDKAFDFATDKVIDIGSKAIGQFVPGTEGLVKKGLVKLKEKLGEGKAKPKRVMSQKQKEYQEALKMIREKYGLSFKETLQKYKQLNSKLK
jgi:hypothetical protein